MVNRRRRTGIAWHADHREILDWLRRWPAPPRRTHLVHGEPGALDAMRGHLERKLGWSVHVPEHGETVRIAT